MAKTLVIILSETRASELTFDNFKKNVIDELNADLCICIGIKPDYDYNNPFYNLAKYKFLYNEPNDFGDAFEYAYNILSKDRPKYEILKNINSLHSKIKDPTQSTEKINYYGTNESNIINFDNFNEDEIIIHTKDFPDDLWKNKVYGIKKSDNNNVSQEHVITYKKPLYWREFLKISFKGWGVKGANTEHPASSGILLFFRWFLLKNLLDNDLINKYDRFIITRSDFIYTLPYPNLSLLDEQYIWIPDGEKYNGYTDRTAVLSKTNIISYLNILNQIILKSNDYYDKMKTADDWNLEKLIKFHLNEEGKIVKLFPYIMYSVKSVNGTTRWSEGVFNEELGYNIKYPNEYKAATEYKNDFDLSNNNIDEFYKNKINIIQNNIESFSVIPKNNLNVINAIIIVLVSLFLIILINTKNFKKFIKYLNKIFYKIIKKYKC